MSIKLNEKFVLYDKIKNEIIEYTGCFLFDMEGNIFMVYRKQGNEELSLINFNKGMELREKV